MESRGRGCCGDVMAVVDRRVRWSGWSCIGVKAKVLLSIEVEVEVLNGGMFEFSLLSGRRDGVCRHQGEVRGER